jgi:DNA mismatch repair protein MutL
LSQNKYFQPTKENYYTWSWTKFKSYSPYKNISSNPNQSQIKSAIEFSREILDKNAINHLSTQQKNEADIHFTKLGKIIGQIHNSYIIVEINDWIKFFDQHALAERIIFEKLINVEKKISSQQLLIWESINLTPIEANNLNDNASIFKEIWFDFEILHKNIVIISSVPDFIRKEDIWEIFIWILEDVWNSWLKKSKTLDEVRNKIFAYTACRSAIKFWNKLNLFEMNKLLNDSIESYSSTCPHWRPVVFEIKLEELKRKYER